jgi:hypothetical protein
LKLFTEEYIFSEQYGIRPHSGNKKERGKLFAHDFFRGYFYVFSFDGLASSVHGKI